MLANILPVLVLLAPDSARIWQQKPSAILAFSGASFEGCTQAVLDPDNVSKKLKPKLTIASNYFFDQ